MQNLFFQVRTTYGGPSIILSTLRDIYSKYVMNF